MGTPLTAVTGIGPKTAEYLRDNGIANAEQLLASGRDPLCSAPGFSLGRADNVLQAAASLLGTAPAAVASPVEAAGKVKGKKSGKDKAKKKKGSKQKSKGEEKKKPKKTKKQKEKKKKKEKKQKKNK